MKLFKKKKVEEKTEEVIKDGNLRAGDYKLEIAVNNEWFRISTDKSRVSDKYSPFVIIEEDWFEVNNNISVQFIVDFIYNKMKEVCDKKTDESIKLCNKWNRKDNNE